MVVLCLKMSLETSEHTRASSTKTLTVTGRVNVVREFRYSNLKPRLNIRHDLLVTFRGHESDGQALSSETTRPPEMIEYEDIQRRQRETYPTR